MASGLRSRILTALLLAALVILVLVWLPPWAAVGAVVLFVLAGAWEWAGFAGLEGAAGRTAYLCAIGVSLAFAWWYTATPEGFVLFLKVAAGWWLLAVLWLLTAARRVGPRSAAIAGFAVLVPTAIGLGRLALVVPQGQTLLLFLLVLIAAADIGAYFGGRRFGRHKLVPAVSPGKTWEGLVAGMTGAVIAAVAGAILLDQPAGTWLLVCMPVALLSVAGDLVESMFKRGAGLKDSGALLPGHGGVLDRLDSLSAAAPAFLLGLHTVGVVA